MVVWNKTSDLLPETYEQVYDDGEEKFTTQESDPVLIRLVDGVVEEGVPYEFAYYEIDDETHIYWVTEDGWSYEPNEVEAWASLEELK